MSKLENNTPKSCKSTKKRARDTPHHPSKAKGGVLPENLVEGDAEYAGPVHLPNELLPAFDSLQHIVSLVNAGSAVPEYVHQQLAGFLAEVQPRLDLINLTNVSFQIARLVRLYKLIGKAEVRVERRLNSPTIETKDLATILKALYGERQSITEVLSNKAKSPSISSADRMTQTATTTPETPEHRAIPIESRRRLMPLMEQLRANLRRHAESIELEQLPSTETA